MSAYADVYFKTICQCIRQMNIHRSGVHCGSAFEPGGFGLHYYCTPPVCVPAVLGVLAVWRLSKKTKTKLSIANNAGLSPSVFFSSFFFKKKVLLCLVVGGGGFHRSWDHCTQEIFLLLRDLANEAERTLDLPKHGTANQGLPLVVNGVSCWVRSKRKRRGSV